MHAVFQGISLSRRLGRMMQFSRKPICRNLRWLSGLCTWQGPPLPLKPLHRGTFPSLITGLVSQGWIGLPASYSHPIGRWVGTCGLLGVPWTWWHQLRPSRCLRGGRVKGNCPHSKRPQCWGRVGSHWLSWLHQSPCLGSGEAGGTAHSLRFLSTGRARGVTSSACATVGARFCDNTQSPLWHCLEIPPWGRAHGAGST